MLMKQGLPFTSGCESAMFLASLRIALRAFYSRVSEVLSLLLLAVTSKSKQCHRKDTGKMRGDLAGFRFTLLTLFFFPAREAEADKALMRGKSNKHTKRKPEDKCMF